MAILDVVQIGHPSLRSTAELVTRQQIQEPSTQQLVDDLVETMRAAPGVGLAVPQVAVNLRLFVAEAHPNKRRPNIQDMELLVVFNPEVEVLDDTWEGDWEACLSIERGEMLGIVPRHARIRLHGLDRNAEQIAVELEGFHARIAQHEHDHLDGILFFDRMYERAPKLGKAVIATRENYERYFVTTSEDSN